MTGINLVQHQGEGEATLVITNDQGIASLVLEPDRDLLTLLEAVEILARKVVYHQKRGKGGSTPERKLITQMADDLLDIAKEDRTTFEHNSLKKMLKLLGRDSELLLDYRQRRKGAPKKSR